MKQMITTYYEGNIKPVGSLVRIIAGLVLIIFSLHNAIVNSVDMSYIILIGSLVVLTGIARWDPIYALFRPINSNEKRISGDVLPGNA